MTGGPSLLRCFWGSELGRRCVFDSVPKNGTHECVNSGLVSHVLHLVCGTRCGGETKHASPCHVDLGALAGKCVCVATRPWGTGKQAHQLAQLNSHHSSHGTQHTHTHTHTSTRAHTHTHTHATQLAHLNSPVRTHQLNALNLTQNSTHSTQPTGGNRCSR